MNLTNQPRVADHACSQIKIDISMKSLNEINVPKGQ